MGGFGSGRHGFKQKAEDCRSLDVNHLHRESCLEPGRSGNWIWSQDGEEIGRIGYRTEEGQIVFHYRVRVHGGEWMEFQQPTQLTYTQCHYGSNRPYFICPAVVKGRACRRRVGKLFASGNYFLCRHCSNVAYTSQSEVRHDRMLRRAKKVRRSLEAESESFDDIASKPKGMWQRTYQRKRWEIQWYENQADQLFLSKFHRLLSKDKLRSYRRA